jgi:hypothetical protein
MLPDYLAIWHDPICHHNASQCVVALFIYNRFVQLWCDPRHWFLPKPLMQYLHRALSRVSLEDPPATATSHGAAIHSNRNLEL